MRFLDVKTDYAFKKVFGSFENKEILIDFLNALVDFPNGRIIIDLTIVDPYNIPMIQGMKDTYVDVKAVLDDKSTVIIEMQVLNHQGFEKRILYNAAKNYSMQLNKSEEYSLLNPVIALTIVDFEMFTDSPLVVNRFKLLEKESIINYSDDIELIFIELPKFTLNENELKDIKDKWIYFIKNAGSLEYIPENFTSNIKKAMDCVNEAGLTMLELEEQYKRKEFISIQKLALKKAINDGTEIGLKLGIEQGIEKGIDKGILLVAKELLLSGISMEIISKSTKLSIDELNKIKNDL